ncbi:MAG TPA: hypothetical protein VF348_09125 [Usitatibacter sp.]
MTELEILRRRRELVLLSAGLQRATLVRRLERIDRHPAHAVLRFAAGAVTLPVVWKVAWSMAAVRLFPSMKSLKR